MNFGARTAPEDSTVNNIGQLPCASASVLRYTASDLASVSEATVSVLVSVSTSTALVTTLLITLLVAHWGVECCFYSTLVKYEYRHYPGLTPALSYQILEYTLTAWTTFD